MIVAGISLLAANPAPSREEIVQAMERHICRCGAYARIVRAIETAAALKETAVAGGVS
jgi:aerobic-type carbon monoxide dehydrogenase small subunit (CoxS/CutS family)